MLNRIKIKNFKSIQDMDLYFEKSNNIIWENWAWKTNILQAVCCLFQNNSVWKGIKDYVKIWEKNIFLEWIFLNGDVENKITFSYDSENEKKLITLNWKKVTKKVLNENILKISYFSPISMNLFYLWPKNRRDFIDDLLSDLFQEYQELLKTYENIVKNRNKVLQNIYIWESKKQEIIFWDENFIKTANQIYKYRIDFNNFILEHLGEFKNIFWEKIKNISYKYITKVDLENIELSIKAYLDENLERDIILWKTHIWPHIDDFDIMIDDKSLIEYASRWEIKSVLINLKLLEILYIKKITFKNPIILIDDFVSEIDEKHQKILIEKLSNFQIIFTSILATNSQENKLIII